MVLYERESKVGGLLSTSIPPFRFDHRQLQWELDMILATGIEVRTDSNVGTGENDVKIDDLLAEYDAVFVSIGMMKGRILPIPGKDAPQVTDAMTFLRQISYDRIPEHFPIAGRVVVVGGGAIATDACQSSIKLGAKEVWMVAIEPEDRLPAFGNELHEAKEIGLQDQVRGHRQGDPRRRARQRRRGQLRAAPADGVRPAQRQAHLLLGQGGGGRGALDGARRPGHLRLGPDHGAARARRSR